MVQGKGWDAGALLEMGERESEGSSEGHNKMRDVGSRKAWPFYEMVKGAGFNKVSCLGFKGNAKMSELGG